MKQPSQRQRRVNEQLRGIISQTLHQGHFRDEVLFKYAPDVTVGDVDASPDLKNATVYVMTLNGHDLRVILEALNKAAPYFQSEINRQMNIKFTPRLTFKEDTSFAEADRIEKLLNNVK